MKKDKLLAFRLSEKNVIYLTRMGFLSPSRKAAPKGAPNLSQFLNQILTHTLESGHHGMIDVVSTEDLLEAYWLTQTIIISKKYDKLNAEMKFAQDRRAEAEMKVIERTQLRNGSYIN